LTPAAIISDANVCRHSCSPIGSSSQEDETLQQFGYADEQPQPSDAELLLQQQWEAFKAQDPTTAAYIEAHPEEVNAILQQNPGIVDGFAVQQELNEQVADLGNRLAWVQESRQQRAEAQQQAEYQAALAEQVEAHATLDRAATEALTAAGLRQVSSEDIRDRAGEVTRELLASGVELEDEHVPAIMREAASRLEREAITESVLARHGFGRKGNQ
jgi:hypothetical protein